MTNLDQSLHKTLALLGKLNWQTPLLELAEKFHRIPSDEITFQEELLNALMLLQENQKQDKEIPITQIFAIRFSKLNCWHFRFTKSTDSGKTFLNPLTHSLQEFKNVEVSVSSSPYPAEDIIKRWVRDRLS